MAVNEGSTKSFLKNFNDMLKSYQNHYGLTKEESDALGKEMVSQATTRMLTALGVGVGAVSGSGLPLDMTIASSVNTGTAGNITGGINNAGRRNVIDKDNELVKSAIKKVNAAGGIPAAGTFNNAINNSFIDNLRNVK